MAITIDWTNKIIDSSASITDLPLLHDTLRDMEESTEGAIYPVTHLWKRLNLGSGGYFYSLELTNGYTLRFPTPGNYTIIGNLSGTIVPTVGVYIERVTSAAFVTTSVGASGSTPEQVAQAVWTHSFVSKLLTVAKFLGLK